MNNNQSENIKTERDQNADHANHEASRVGPSGGSLEQKNASGGKFSDMKNQNSKDIEKDAKSSPGNANGRKDNNPANTPSYENTS